MNRISDVLRDHAGRLRNIAHKYGGERHTEDALHTGIMCALDSIRRVDKRRPVLPWVCACVHNAALDLIKRHDNRTLALEDEAARASLVLRDDASDAMERAETAREVRLAVERLPDGLRRVVLARYFEGHDYEAAARATGINIGTFKSRLFRAHRALRRRSAGLR